VRSGAARFAVTAWLAPTVYHNTPAVGKAGKATRSPGKQPQSTRPRCASLLQPSLVPHPASASMHAHALPAGALPASALPPRRARLLHRVVGRVVTKCPPQVAATAPASPYRWSNCHPSPCSATGQPLRPPPPPRGYSPDAPAQRKLQTLRLRTLLHRVPYVSPAWRVAISWLVP
jgi:hypothetical protein